MPSQNKKKNKIVSLATTWIFGFVCALVLVASIYTAFLGREYVNTGEEIYDNIVYVNTPGTTQVAGMEGYGVTTYGENGLVVNKALKNDVKNVLFWGDSFVKAIQVSDHDKFTEIVERAWNKAYPDDKIQTLNIGQVGLDTRAYIQFSGNVDNVFSPDLIFLMLGSSDFEPLAKRKDLEQKIISGNFDNLLRPKSGSKLRSIVNDVGLQGFAARLKRQTFAFLEGSRNNTSKSDIDDNSLVDQNLRRSIVIQLEALKSIWGDRLVILYRHRVSDYGNNLEEGQNSALYQSLVQMNIEFIDTHSVLSKAMKEGNPPHGFINFNLGQGHLNHTGHKIVADLVVQYLEDKR